MQATAQLQRHYSLTSEKKVIELKDIHMERQNKNTEKSSNNTNSAIDLPNKSIKLYNKVQKSYYEKVEKNTINFAK